jgi:hypothetical protein
MSFDFKAIKIGLLITLLSLIFSVGIGVVFGANEKVFKDYISKNIEMNQSLHDEQSSSKIWRYAQRSHFHAGGIAAYSLALLLIILFSKMKDSYKKLSSIMIGLGTLYPLSWFVMFLMAPHIGREAAKHNLLTESIVYISMVGFVVGLVILMGSLFFNSFNEEK